MKLATVSKTTLLCVSSILLLGLTSSLESGVPATMITKEPAIRKVVIDPGHGGKDPGCRGRTTVEKDIAAVGLKLGELIHKHFPDIEVIYTREDRCLHPAA